MARSALRALDTLELLGVDSLLFISDEADGRAELGRANGLDDAVANAGANTPSAAFGLNIAEIAPAETPAEPDHPDGPPEFGIGTSEFGWDAAAGRSGPAIEIGAITILDPQLMGGKGGIPGPPGGGGGGSGGSGGSDGVYDDYFSGSSLGADTNPGGNDPGFDIWIDFKGTWSYDLQQAFINAADYFTTIITADIGGGGLYRGKVIDDLYVTAELKAIDGTGGILGQAGPTAVWTAGNLTAAGQMQFDSADAQAFFDIGLWDDIVTHELMHVLGFGTLWDFGIHDLVSGEQYTGANALAAYLDGTANFIPVETDGGSGTAGGHWNEILSDYSKDPGGLDNELMTGFIDDSNYLSKFSVMVLADLGYEVDYSAGALFV
jgi:hypothetical protein